MADSGDRAGHRVQIGTQIVISCDLGHDDPERPGFPAAAADKEPDLENFTLPEVTADDHVLGPAAAPVTVLEYGDYECPFCRGAYRDVHRMLDLYPGSIRFAFRNFPIQQLHPHAEQAAEAAEAAAAQGKFWEMYELLLRPSSSLDLDSLVSRARDLGLDTDRFRREVTGRAYAAKIEGDVREGINNGVNATPKFYVDGERIDGKFPLEGLEDAIRASVRAAAAG
jgi:protein-disulfide isomerase